jgi:hypothetical protein
MSACPHPSPASCCQRTGEGETKGAGQKTTSQVERLRQCSRCSVHPPRSLAATAIDSEPQGRCHRALVAPDRRERRGGEGDAAPPAACDSGALARRDDDRSRHHAYRCESRLCGALSATEMMDVHQFQIRERPQFRAMPLRQPELRARSDPRKYVSSADRPGCSQQVCQRQ